MGEESRAQLLQTGGTGRVRDSVWARERQAPSCHLRSCTLIKTATTFAIWSHHELHPAPTTTQPITADMGRKKIQIQRITDERNRQVRSFFLKKIKCMCMCVWVLLLLLTLNEYSLLYLAVFIFGTSELCHLFYLTVLSLAVFLNFHPFYHQSVGMSCRTKSVFIFLFLAT